MNKEAILKDHFLEVLRPVFPVDADVSSYIINDSIHIQVYWYLENDPAHPHKHSRPILIELSKDMLEHYTHTPVEAQHTLDQQLYQYIAQKLKSFDPDHNLPNNSPIPEEKWQIETAQIH